MKRCFSASIASIGAPVFLGVVTLALCSSVFLACADLALASFLESLRIISSLENPVFRVCCTILRFSLSPVMFAGNAISLSLSVFGTPLFLSGRELNFRLASES